MKTGKNIVYKIEISENEAIELARMLEDYQDNSSIINEAQKDIINSIFNLVNYKKEEKKKSSNVNVDMAKYDAIVVSKGKILSKDEALDVDEDDVDFIAFKGKGDQLGIKESESEYIYFNKACAAIMASFISCKGEGVFSGRRPIRSGDKRSIVINIDSKGNPYPDTSKNVILDYFTNGKVLSISKMGATIVLNEEETEILSAFLNEHY